MRQINLFLSTVFICTISLFGQPPEFVKQIHAVRLTEGFHVDGNLSESIYQQPGVKEFYQKDPNQGEPVSEPTEVWVAYDDAALYIGAMLKDSHADSIIPRLSRRDNDVGGDQFAVGIDSYHDKRNGYYFTVSAAGTLLDGILYNDDWSDGSWNGVWEAKQILLSDGWSVEIRIPFSQLRFEEKEEYVWGIAFERMIGRKKEQSYTVYTPRNESGFVSRFAELTGINHISPPSRYEATPYVTERAEYLNHQPGDPFHPDSKYRPDIGMDFKLGLGTNLTLDGAINPDFGQVEVDPAVVNLSAVETYYGEKRPFFIEGMNIFAFGQGGVNDNWGFNWSAPEIFYSRRVGRAPQRGLPKNDFAEVPLGTRILGAVKLTGKVFDGWNVGVIEALTNREYARIDTSGVHRDFEVEPLTSYSIGRVQKDFNDGKQGIGFLSTYTHRFFKDLDLRETVNENSWIGGLDGWTALDGDKEYVVSGWTTFSYVQGTRDRIFDLQESWPHYYGRPDAGHVSIDSSATSLSGFAGRYALNKQKGRVVLNAAIGFISPGFEPGDLGYFSRADVVNYHIVTGYKWNDPTPYYRYINLYGSYFSSFDFGGNVTWRGLWGRLNYQLPNYHSFGFYYDYGFESVDNGKTRGGPLMLNLPAYEWGLEYYTDSRNDYIGEAYWYSYEGNDGFSHNLELYLTLRPLSNISITIGPRILYTFDRAAWINDGNNPFADPSAVSTYGKRYIFADLDQKLLSAQIRLNWTFTPTISLQLFVQPLFSSGHYSNFKELAKARSFDFNVFGANGSQLFDSTSSNGNYYLSSAGTGPSSVIEIGNPDFNKVSLRGNAVLRWEYMPGSTLFLVWTQSRYDDNGAGHFTFRRSLEQLGSAKPDNIFMLKVTYWLGG
jgi:hypothetical protein